MKEGHPEFMAAIDEIIAMHLNKSADYGTDEDVFANIRGAVDFGVPAWVGAILRANDKMFRIKSLLMKGSLKNEPLEDAFLDMASYALIALVLYREGRRDP